VEGSSAYQVVQALSRTTPAAHSPVPTTAGNMTPAGGLRLSAAHIAITPTNTAAAAGSAAAAGPSVAATPTLRTPAAIADVSRAVRAVQLHTPLSGAAHLAQQVAVSPSLMTPGVMQAVAAAGTTGDTPALLRGAGAYSTGGAGVQQQQQQGASAAATDVSMDAAAANLTKIKQKLGVLKEHIEAKTQKLGASRKAQIQGQIEKLERSLAYVEKQRVSAASSPGGARLRATQQQLQPPQQPQQQQQQ
jgi:hypothetical protein